MSKSDTKSFQDVWAEISNGLLLGNGVSLRKAPNSDNPVADFIRLLFVRVLSNWKKEYCYDSLINEVRSRDLISEDALPELALYEKFRQRSTKLIKEKKPVYVYASEILEHEDVAEFILAIIDHYGLGGGVSDHPNLDLLAGLLDAEGIEKVALNAALLIPSSDCQFFTNDSYSVYSRLDNFAEIKNNRQAYETLLGFTQEQFEEVDKGGLRKSGVLVKSSETGLFTLNAELARIFRKKNLTVEYIEEQMFPSVLKSDLKIADYPHVKTEVNRVAQIIDRSREARRRGNNILFYGPPGTGKTELVLAMAKERGWSLRVVGDMSNSDMQERGRSDRLVALRLAIKVLGNDPKSVLLFDEMEDLFVGDKTNTSKAYLNRLLENSPVPIIWTTNSLRNVEYSLLRRMVYNVHLDIPPAKTRALIWQRYAREFGLRLSRPTTMKLAERYRIAPALIRNAVSVAYAVVGDSTGKRAEKEVHEVVESLSRVINLGVTESDDDCGSTSNTPYDLTCINSATDVVQLTEDIMGAKPQWSLCLHGAPGTGKSEYGRYLAKQIKKKVLYKRASDLMSKWVGETEQNIAEAFREAKESKTVLLIDEGDSFLRNRELARNSWEITAVNEMLSQMERHSQPFILTTNLMKDLDTAALRRFTFKLKFEFLKPEQSRKLFKQYFNCTPPDDIDRNTKLAPGDFANVKRQVDIRNVTDPQRIYELLKEETDLKSKGESKPIGFKV